VENGKHHTNKPKILLLEGVRGLSPVTEVSLSLAQEDKRAGQQKKSKACSQRSVSPPRNALLALLLILK